MRYIIKESGAGDKINVEAIQQPRIGRRPSRLPREKKISSRCRGCRGFWRENSELAHILHVNGVRRADSNGLQPRADPQSRTCPFGRVRAGHRRAQGSRDNRQLDSTACGSRPSRANYASVPPFFDAQHNPNTRNGGPINWSAVSCAPGGRPKAGMKPHRRA